MKMLSKLLLIVLALLVTVVPALADSYYAAQIDQLPNCYRYLTSGEAVMYSASDIPVYAEAKTSSEMLGRVNSGSTVNVLLLSRNGDWAFITGGSLPAGGWIRSYVLVNANVLQNNAVVVAGSPGLRVNLRTAPDANADTQGKYYTGTLVQILDQSTLAPNGKGYVLVRVGDAVGYMDRERLVDSLSNTWSELPVQTVYNWSQSQHPLYNQPNRYGQPIGYVPNSSSVTVLGIRNDGWYHVMYQGQIGYIQTYALQSTLPWDLDPDNPDDNVIILNDPNAMYVLSSKPGNRVNLRTKPSTDAVSLCKYYTGAPVVSLGDVINGYMHIRIGHVEGYMDTRFLMPDMLGIESELIISQVAAQAGYAPVYKWNQSDSSIKTTLYNGTKVFIIGFSDKWCHMVYDNDQHGFILRTDLFPTP